MIDTGIRFLIDASGAKSGAREVKSALDSISPAAEGAQQRINGVTTSIEELPASTKRAGQELGVTKQRFSEFGREADRVRDKVFNIRNAFVGIGFVGLVKDISNTGKELQSVRIAFETVFESVENANDQFNFALNISNRLGTDLSVVTSSWLRFAAAAKGTALEGSKSQKIFQQVVESIKAMGGSSDKTQGALLALEQILSKNRVQAEELRGQLGERVFGAFNQAALAIGVTTEELDDLLKKGELSAENFLPKFAEQLATSFPLSEKAINSFDSAFGRFTNSLKLFKEQAFNAGLEDALMKVFLDTAEALSKVDIENFVESLVLGVRSLSSLFILLIDNLDKVILGFKVFIGLQLVSVFSSLVSSLSSLVAVFGTLIPLIVANPFAALGIGIVAVTGYLLTFTDKLDFLKSALSDFKDFVVRVFDTIGERVSRVFGSEGFRKGLQAGVDGKNPFTPPSFVPSFEGGGVMTSSGPIPLRKYSGGGIANSPQLALFGEGSTPEAFVPVPNGKIPVELNGAGKQSIVNNIFTTNPEGAVQKLPGTGTIIAEFSRAKNALDQYVESIKIGSDAIADIMGNAVNQMEDRLVEFFKTGKFNFRDFLSSIQEDILRSFTQQQITGPISNALGGIISGGLGGSAGGIFAELSGLFGFANGGVMSSSGPIPLRRYQTGGIANSPQLALFGEGRQNEAFVPLPDGRSIPVRLQNERPSSPVMVNMTVVTRDSESFRRSQGQISSELAKTLSRSKARYT